MSRRSANAAISVLGLSSQQLASLIVTFLAAGVLGPADYGVYVIATVFVELVIALTYTGYFHFLVTVSEDEAEAALPTLFWLMVAIGAAGGAALWLAAPGLARLFDAPELAPVLRAFGAMQPFASAVGWASAVLTREGRMRRYFLALAGANLGGLAGGAAVLLAWPSLQALVLYRAIRLALGLALFLPAARHRPRLRFDPALARRATGYAAGLYGARLMAFVAHFGTDLLLGLVFSTAEAGLYRFANRLAAAAVDVIGHPVRSFALTRFGAAARAGTPLGPVLAQSLATGVFLMGGFAIAVAGLGRTVTEVLFRPEYLAALPAFYALALRAAATAGTQLVEPVFAARARTRVAMGFDMAWASAMIAAIAWAAPLGLAPLAWAQAAVGVGGAVAALWTIGRWGGVPLEQALARTGPALGLLALYGGALALLWPPLQALAEGPARLALGLALAAGMAAPVCWIALRRGVLDMRLFD